MKITIEFDVPKKLQELKARVVGAAKAARYRLKYIGRDIPVPRTEKDIERIWEFEKYLLKSQLEGLRRKITHLAKAMEETSIPRKEYALHNEIQLQQKRLGTLLERLEALKDIRDITSEMEG